MTAAAASLPIVLVPVDTNEAALDACLAALDAHTPAGTRVWLADDAQTGPRGLAIIERWLANTALQAAHTRRASPLGEAAHIQQALQACAEADVAVLAADTSVTPGWLERLQACFASDATIVSATPWCNAGELAAWPRMGEVAPVSHAPALLAEACAALPTHYPNLPAAVSHAVLLRGTARVAAGGVDGASFRSWYAALIDLTLRMAGLGGRNVLCESTFVLREKEGHPVFGDMDALAARWPAWHANLAHCLMHDPMHALRSTLASNLTRLQARPPQADLFAGEV
jgi:hypothetical protein